MKKYVGIIQRKYKGIMKKYPLYMGRGTWKNFVNDFIGGGGSRNFQVQGVPQRKDITRIKMKRHLIQNQEKFQSKEERKMEKRETELWYVKKFVRKGERGGDGQRHRRILK